MPVPPTSDDSWRVAWGAWNGNEKAYWWHRGRRAYNRDLAPKKTGQLIYAFYTTVAGFAGREDFLIDYIDADICPPSDHMLAAAVGIRHYDVVQGVACFPACLSLWVNALAMPIGAWVATYAAMLLAMYRSTWKRSALELGSWRARLWYLRERTEKINANAPLMQHLVR